MQDLEELANLVAGGMMEKRGLEETVTQQTREELGHSLKIEK